LQHCVRENNTIAQTEMAEANHTRKCHGDDLQADNA